MSNITKYLIEALPYIQKFKNKTLVIKYGGNAMLDNNLKTSFAKDIVLMNLVGMKPIIVHGGGPQISSLLTKLGKKSEFLEGIRVTDSETMDIVEMVLGGAVNKEIVNLIHQNGGSAVGLTGKDGFLVKAKKLNKKCHKKDIMLDFGYVGKIEKINPKILELLINGSFIPIIAPIGVGSDGKSYNINADTMAGGIASNLKAEKMILLTNTEGVLDKNGKLISVIKFDEIKNLIKNSIVTDGMIPKLECVYNSMQEGVKNIHIIDGRKKHALLLELLTDKGTGTMFIK